jgi:hypothetical protein
MSKKVKQSVQRPVQALKRSRRLRLPDFLENQHMNVVRLSPALEKIWTEHFLCGRCWPIGQIMFNFLEEVWVTLAAEINIFHFCTVILKQM